MGASSSDYSEWNIDEKWSSQEWKSGPAGPFTQHTDRFVIDDDDMDPNSATESDLSLKSRSFLHRVNDRVRKMLDQSSTDAMQDRDEHSLIWRMFLSSTLETYTFMGKNYSEKLHAIKNTREQSHIEEDAWHIWKDDSRTIRWAFWSVPNQLGKVFHGNSCYLWFTSIINLKGRSMWWRILILFPQTSSLRIKKLCCMCLKTMKQWSKWSLKEGGVLLWDTFPEPTELLLIGCSIESI